MTKLVFSSFIALLILMTGCYSFDKEVALKEFKELKPDCDIIEIDDYECDGTLGECWYVKFKYKKPDAETIYDTTLQYWNRGNEWITNKEKITRNKSK